MTYICRYVKFEQMVRVGRFSFGRQSSGNRKQFEWAFVGGDQQRRPFGVKAQTTCGGRQARSGDARLSIRV